MGSSTTNATSTSSSSPWTAQQPYLKDQFKAAQDIYKNSNPQYYPGSTVAPMSAGQNSAISGTNDFAGQGFGLKNAMSQNDQIASGNFGTVGSGVLGNIMSQVLPQVNSQFEGAGRYGSDSHAGALGTAVTNAWAPYASSMMNSALDRSGTLSNDYQQGLSNQFQMGANQQTQAQQETNDAVNRYNYAQNLPAQKLAQYAGFTGGNYGNTTSTSTPVSQPGLFSQLAGGLLGLGGLIK